MPDLFTGGYGPRPTYQQQSWALSPFNLYPPPPTPPVASGAGGTPPATTITPNAGLPTPYGTGPLSPAIAGLIQPGLVPDIARMSAEVTAGRGVAGSPAADSTAVKMSEQNYLQRLGLANQLLTGEAGRALPYQVTPLQAAELANRLAVAGMRNFPWGGNIGGNYRSGSGYGGGGGGLGRPTSLGGAGSLGGGGALGGSGNLFGPQGQYYGVGGGSLYGGGGGGVSGGQSPSLDDMLRDLGIFGEDETGGGTQPPDFDWEMWQ